MERDFKDGEQQDLKVVRLANMKDSSVVHYVPEECSDEPCKVLSRLEG